MLTWVIPEMLLGRGTRLQPSRDQALLLAPGVSDSTLLCDTPQTGQGHGTLILCQRFWEGIPQMDPKVWDRRAGACDWVWGAGWDNVGDVMAPGTGAGRGGGYGGLVE